MERKKICVASVVSLALLSCLASLSWAQIEIGGFVASGEAEVGGLPRHKSGGKDAKFEEYRDLPESVIVPQLQLMLGGKKNDFYLRFDAGEVGRSDQSYKLRAGRYGLLDIEFEWKQIPHLFNVDTARTPYNGHDGTYTLSSKPPQASATTNPSGTAFNNFLNGPEMHDVDLKLLYGIAKLNVRYTPTPGWNLTGTYWSQNTTGKRAFGTIFGPSPGGNVVELPEPIDYQSHNIELGAEYAGKGWSLGLAYNASLFHNNVSTLVWDNPNNATGVGSNCQDYSQYAATGSGTNTFSSTLPPGPPDGRVYNRLFGPCRGRLDLYPSSQAHSFTLTGTADLPLNSHFISTVSYGWNLQNDSFLPMTINSCFGSGLPADRPSTCPQSTDPVNNPNPFLALPSISHTSLNGDVRPLMVNATLVNNFFDKLDLKAFYRLYDLDNRSNKVFFKDGIIINDQAGSPNVEPGERCIAGAPGTVTCPEQGVRSFNYAYSKQNIGLDTSYNLARWLTAKMSYLWEKMHRDRREVLDSNEHSVGPTFDFKPNSWLLVRMGYKKMLRDAHNYDAGRQVVIDTEGEPQEIRDERLEALRKFDEAARDRDKFNLFTQISPFQNLTLYGGFDFNNDRYSRTEIGVKNDIDYAPSIGMIYAPLDWLTFFTDYNWERFAWKMKAMQRNGPVVTLTNPISGLDQTPENTPANIWTSRGRDEIHTFSLGSDIRLIKDVLGFRIQYGFSQGSSVVHASGNSGNPTAIATNYPTISNRWHELLARFEYTIHKNVGLRLGYYYNRYAEKDFGVDIMKPWMGDVDTGGGVQRSIFLGDRLKGSYTAHVGFVGLRFKF